MTSGVRKPYGGVLAYILYIWFPLPWNSFFIWLLALRTLKVSFIPYWQLLLSLLYLFSGIFPIPPYWRIPRLRMYTFSLSTYTYSLYDLIQSLCFKHICILETPNLYTHFVLLPWTWDSYINCLLGSIWMANKHHKSKLYSWYSFLSPSSAFPETFLLSNAPHPANCLVSMLGINAHFYFAHTSGSCHQQILLLCLQNTTKSHPFLIISIISSKTTLVQVIIS